MAVEAKTVEVNGQQVTIERFKLAKAMRVVTLVNLLQKQVPEISRHWAGFRKRYAEEYATDIDRIQALARYGPALEHISDAEWERAGQKFTIPGAPSQAEVFFEMFPLVYEKAEQVTLRLLGLIAMDNKTVERYVDSGDIWERVDELVDELIKPAALDEIMELALTAAEVIDGQVLSKARNLGDRAGNVARLFGWNPTTTTTGSGSTPSEMSSGSPEQPRITSPSDSPSISDGGPGMSSTSTGMSSRTSEPSSALSVS